MRGTGYATASHLAINVRNSKQVHLELAVKSWQTVRFQNHRCASVMWKKCRNVMLKEWV